MVGLRSGSLLLEGGDGSLGVERLPRASMAKNLECRGLIDLVVAVSVVVVVAFALVVVEQRAAGISAACSG